MRVPNLAYAIKELFKTLQGEGGQSGCAAVFCRFTGCNLWSGLEKDRSRAICRFCDTDFVGMDGNGGGRFVSASALTDAIASSWGPGEPRRYVVFTGGEPLLQLDAALIAAVHAKGFEIAVETNGTIAAPPGVDWLCVSPKADAPLVQTSGHELKLVFPQVGAMPEAFKELDFRHFFLQPMDGPQRAVNTRLAIDYCLQNPQWRISLQTHKIMDIP